MACRTSPRISPASRSPRSRSTARRWTSSIWGRCWRRRRCSPMRGFRRSAGTAPRPVGSGWSRTGPCAPRSRKRRGLRQPRRSSPCMRFFRLTGVERFALVSPYLAGRPGAYRRQLRGRGLHLRRRAASGHKGQFLVLRGRCRDAARPGAGGCCPAPAGCGGRCCAPICAAPGLVEALEREIGIPVYDATSAAVWAALRVAGADTDRVAGWGRLFREVGRK